MTWLVDINLYHVVGLIALVCALALIGRRL